MFGRKTAPPAADRWLIIGLGNPGREYVDSRHNIGFLCIDALARRLKTEVRNRAAQSLIARQRLETREVVLAKPQTMMNRSGLAGKTLRARYGVPLDRTFVIHDELDLPFGRIRVRLNGSAAGHHGIESLIEGFGSRAFARFRVGIGRPPGDGADHVLSPFTSTEREALQDLLARVCDAVLLAVEHGLDRAMTEFNKG